MQKQEISLHTPHPFASLRTGSDPLPQGERELGDVPLPRWEGVRGRVNRTI